MKTVNKILIVSCLLASSLGVAGSAQAAWMFSHGNVAQIENPANCTYKYFGWGLDMQQKSGLYNWVHLTVPTQYGGGVGARYVKLRFYTGSIDASVSEIHVYNGETRVKVFKGLNYSNGWKTVQLDLGSKMAFSKGMGFSVKIGAGVEMMSHQFIFSSAGANFIP